MPTESLSESNARTTGAACWQQRLRLLLLNALVFSLCYTSANTLAQRQGVTRTLALALDGRVPFWEWMVVPYMSSGVLFAASFALVPGRDGLRVLSQRMLLATVLACLVFVLFPLRFSGPAPTPASPVTGALFALLSVLDRPYNQCPSLHVAYGLIFWAALRERLAPGVARGLLSVWLLLMALATVFTGQHHLLDVAGGLVLGLACLCGVRPQRQEPWVAFYYLMGAGVLVILGAGVWPVWLIAYGVAGLLGVGLAYARRDRRFLRKAAGCYPWRTWWLYAPYLTVYWLLWLAVQWRERHHPPFCQMAERLWVGRRLSRTQARQLPTPCTVIDLANELSETAGLRSPPYRHVPLLDLVYPEPAVIDEIVSAIHDEICAGRTVYLHCAMGYSRSRLLAQAYLARTAPSIPAG